MERISVELTDSVLSEWPIPRAMLLDDPLLDSSEAYPIEDVTLIMTAGATAVVQRHGVGPVRIRLSTSDEGSVGRLVDRSGRSRELADWALLMVELGEKPLLLPFRGILVAGDDVAVGVDSILLSGRVSIVEEQFRGGEHYLASVQQLDAGDRVQFMRRAFGQANTSDQAVVDGFVRAEPAAFRGASRGLTVVAHGPADHVQVERLGSAGYRIQPTRWARFLHDPLLAAIAATVTAFAVILQLTSSLFGARGRKKQSSDVEKQEPT